MGRLREAQWLLEQTAQLVHERIAGGLAIRDCATHPPDRTGPRIIRVKSGDVVNMQLRHLITERGDVEFVGGEVRFHRLAQPHRRRVRRRRQLRATLGHGDQPRRRRPQHRRRRWTTHHT